MKLDKFILLWIGLLTGAMGYGQSSVRETRLSILDADRMAFAVDFNFENKVVQDAWSQKMKELKLSGKNQKGIDTYEGIKFPDIHFESIDLFCKIEKLDKTRTSFTLAVSKGYGNFLTDADASIVSNTKNFMSGFITYVEQYKLKLDIKDQEGVIKDTQKSYEKLVDEGKKLTDQLEKNKIDQENKSKELEAAKKLLEDLRGKLK